MKKLLALALCLIMLVSVCVMAVNGAAEAPKGASTTGVKELSILQTLPTNAASNNLLTGLSCSPEYSALVHSADVLSEAQKYDIARYLTYGISAMGVTSLARPLDRMADGYWTSGNTTPDGETNLTNGNKKYGAFDFHPAEQATNLYGEVSSNASENIYHLILTFNFGKIAELDAIAFAGGGINNMPQAADVYISNDGENWTLIGYWDRVAKRIEGGDYTFPIIAESLGNDKLNKALTGADRYVCAFDLGDNVEAQFLRIATTAGCGKTAPADISKRADYSNQYGTTSAWREMFVWGTITNKTGNVTATEKPMVTSTTAADNGSNNGAAVTIPVKTQAATTAAATEAETTAAATTEAEKSGCGSALGMSAVMMAVTVTGTGAVIASKKKRK